MPQDALDDFLENSSEVASFLKSSLDGDVRVKINTHTDPDGISAGNILARCLKYYDIPFHLSFGGPPESDELEELSEQDYDLFIFLDQGTGQFELIDEFLLEKNRNVVILDHHPGDVEGRPNLTFLNPHKFGLNGSEDVSASGVVYEVVENFDDRFCPLSELALIGAIGDRQETPDGFTGVNEIILNRALENGFLNVSEGLKLSGRAKPLVESLSSSIQPYLPGLSGHPDNCNEFIDGLDHGTEDLIEKLDGEEERELYEEILARIDIEPVDHFKRSLWGKIYISKIGQAVGPRNLHEYVRMLVACEKLDKVEVGFSSLLGDDSYRQEAFKCLNTYRERMLDVFRWIESEEDIVRDTSKMRYIDLENKAGSELAGEIASIAIESGLVDSDKPFLALAKSDEDRLKVSARATSDCVESKIDLGDVMSEAAEEFGGSGGGHDVAAAARLAFDMKEEFIEKVNRILERSS